MIRKLLQSTGAPVPATGWTNFVVMDDMGCGFIEVQGECILSVPAAPIFETSWQNLDAAGQPKPFRIVSLMGNVSVYHEQGGEVLWVWSWNAPGGVFYMKSIIKTDHDTAVGAGRGREFPFNWPLDIVCADGKLNLGVYMDGFNSLDWEIQALLKTAPAPPPA